MAWVWSPDWSARELAEPALRPATDVRTPAVAMKD
jgi:hypothetical protein